LLCPPSICLSRRYIQHDSPGAACDAASVHFSPTIRGTDIRVMHYSHIVYLLHDCCVTICDRLLAPLNVIVKFSRTGASGAKRGHTRWRPRTKFWPREHIGLYILTSACRYHAYAVVNGRFHHKQSA